MQLGEHAFKNIADLKSFRRINTLELCLKCASIIYKYQVNAIYHGKDPFIDYPTLGDDFTKVSLDIHMYGKKDEIKVVNAYIEALTKQQDVKKLEKAHNDMCPLIMKRLRIEFELDN